MQNVGLSWPKNELYKHDYIICERLNMAALVWLCVGIYFLQVELQCRMDRRCHHHRSAQSHRLAVQQLNGGWKCKTIQMLFDF